MRRHTDAPGPSDVDGRKGHAAVDDDVALGTDATFYVDDFTAADVPARREERTKGVRKEALVVLAV